MSGSVPHLLETDRSGRKKTTIWCHRVTFYSTWTSGDSVALLLPLHRENGWVAPLETLPGNYLARFVSFTSNSTLISSRNNGAQTKKLPIARRCVRHNDLHFLLHSAAITFVPQVNHSGLPFVTTARPSLQGTHAAVVLIHIQFGSLDSGHAPRTKPQENSTRGPSVLLSQPRGNVQIE